MNNEIKEILDNPKILMLSYGNYISLDDYVKLKNYITNLQERCEYLERSNNRREDEIMSLRDECVDGETYKSRCEKARKMIKFIAYNNERPLTITELNKVYNILGGDDNEWYG